MNESTKEVRGALTTAPTVTNRAKLEKLYPNQKMQSVNKTPRVIDVMIICRGHFQASATMLSGAPRRTQKILGIMDKMPI